MIKATPFLLTSSMLLSVPGMSFSEEPDLAKFRGGPSGNIAFSISYDLRVCATAFVRGADSPGNLKVVTCKMGARPDFVKKSPTLATTDPAPLELSKPKVPFIRMGYWGNSVYSYRVAPGRYKFEGILLSSDTGFGYGFQRSNDNYEFVVTENETTYLGQYEVMMGVPEMSVNVTDQSVRDFEQLRFRGVSLPAAHVTLDERRLNSAPTTQAASKQ